MANGKGFSRIIAGVMTWGTWGKNLSTKEMASRKVGNLIRANKCLLTMMGLVAISRFTLH